MGLHIFEINSEENTFGSKKNIWAYRSLNLEAVEASVVVEAAEVIEAGEVSKALKITT